MHTTANRAPAPPLIIFISHYERVGQLCPRPLGPSWSAPVYWLFHRYPNLPFSDPSLDHFQDDQGVPLSATQGTRHRGRRASPVVMMMMISDINTPALYLVSWKCKPIGHLQSLLGKTWFYKSRMWKCWLKHPTRRVQLLNKCFCLFCFLN